MSTTQYIQQANLEFEKIIEHLRQEFSRLQVGQANAALVESMLIDVYGAKQPLKNLANISVPDSRTLQIQPWDRNIINSIEKAIQLSDLNLSPVNKGTAIFLMIPPLTEERRRDLVKVVHNLAEEARISIRNARQSAHHKFQELEQKKEISEDEGTGAEKKLQEKVNECNDKVAELAKAKEESMMKI
ncbi:MAG: ribosome recycling factor, ribosome recycling factor [Candidatus Peregrinibacteria bacterium GW2011_GWF2_39_17]|nr:MAG: ribosome recycling factor, ribosome recycling factor [Candidatus Peregrinibacteria bacterium GW2011_GWF2_39_17]HCW32051.1 ribosome recycling factor [Candidatus Peregrinibacteria bacterium]